MSLEHQLERWTSAGLLTPEQANAIAEFEQRSERPLFLYAVAGLGAFAIAVGLISIVAANWDEIPSWLKLALDLVLVAVLGFVLTRLERRSDREPGHLDWAREVVIVVLYGLVLASIALIAQVYQLGGKTHEALAVWLGLTALLMTRAYSRASAFLWLMGIQITLLTWLVWLDERFPELDAVLLGSLIVVPLATLAVGRSAKLQQIRPALARTFESVGWAELVMGASFATIAFYSDMQSSWTPSMLVPLLVSAVLCGFIGLSLQRGKEPLPAGRPALALLAVCVLVMYGSLFSPGELGLVAALVFVAAWGLVGLCAHRVGDLRLLNFATAAVGLRILIVYFEVFGSLLDTGIGLVAGGLLTLGIVWLWDRKRRQFRASLTKENS